jgi:hypothetical protein
LFRPTSHDNTKNVLGRSRRKFPILNFKATILTAIKANAGSSEKHQADSLAGWSW